MYTSVLSLKTFIFAEISVREYREWTYGSMVELLLQRADERKTYVEQLH